MSEFLDDKKQSTTTIEGISTAFAWIEGSETGNVRLGGAWMSWSTLPMKYSTPTPLPTPTTMSPQADLTTPSSINSDTTTTTTTEITAKRISKDRDAWTLKTKIPPGTYYFQFVVDGIWRHSIHLPTSQIGAGSNVRMISVPPDEQGIEKVRTEFVWMDEASSKVFLCGEWQDWEAVLMKKVVGGYWSVTTEVPIGEQRFRFLVDGVPKHSTRHAVVAANSLFNVIRIDEEGNNDEQEETKLVNESSRSTRSLRECCCHIC